MARRYNSLFSEENELINLTPLLDVLFVILILFIIIAPLMNIDKIELAESSSKTLSSTSMEDRNAISIYLHADDTVSIGTKKVEPHALRYVLEAIHKQNKETLPRLFIDKKCSFGTFTETKDLIEDCGFSSLDLVVKSKHS